ncbi:hypothetical protein M9434_000680 [Picochlorum sp. BPE23]|nr:hypothetical protein M9434_000680 [Picochlorum sp. BPE23]
MKLLIALALCGLLGCAVGQDEGALLQRRLSEKTMHKAAIMGTATRSISLVAYTDTILDTTKYEFKCVTADTGCDAPAEGTTVSGAFVKGKSDATGTIEGLDPDTMYDCYVITNDKICGKPFRVQTEPVLYVGGSLLACNIVTRGDRGGDLFVWRAGSQITDCLDISGTIEPVLNNIRPLSIVKRDEQISFTYVDQVKNKYGVQTCILNKGATQIDDCETVLENGDEALFGLQIVETKAYIARPSAKDVLLCTILANGTFSDCAPTGPTGEEYVNLYASTDNIYIVRENVTVCSIEANGSLSRCKLAYNMADRGGAYDIAIQGRMAYITNPGANTVSLCTINLDGSLSNCAPTGVDLKSPETILVQGSTAYITSPFENDIQACSILENGEISYCKSYYTPVLGGVTALAI